MTDDPRTHLALTLSANKSVYLYRQGDPTNYVEIYNAGRPNGQPACIRLGITAPIAIRITRKKESVEVPTDLEIVRDDEGHLCVTLGAFQSVYLWQEGEQSDENSIEVMLMDEKRPHRLVVSAPQFWQVYRHPLSEHAIEEVCQEPEISDSMYRQ